MPTAWFASQGFVFFLFIYLFFIFYHQIAVQFGSLPAGQVHACDPARVGRHLAHHLTRHHIKHPDRHSDIQMEYE